jgi:hypothetical protein
VTDHCAVSTQTSEILETENREEGKKMQGKENLAIGLGYHDKILCEWLHDLALSSVYYIDFTRMLYMERK